MTKLKKQFVEILVEEKGTHKFKQIKVKPSHLSELLRASSDPTYKYDVESKMEKISKEWETENPRNIIDTEEHRKKKEEKRKQNTKKKVKE